MAQLSEDDHLALFDSCALWLWLLPKMRNKFPSEIIDRHVDLFNKGLLGQCYAWVGQTAT